jgi:hypothetical protein
MLRRLMSVASVCCVVCGLSTARADDFRPGELEQTAWVGQGWSAPGVQPLGYQGGYVAPAYPVSSACANCPTCARQPAVYPVNYGQSPQYLTQPYPQYQSQPAYNNCANGWCGTPTGTAYPRYPNTGYGAQPYPTRAPNRGGLFGLGLLGGWR